MATGNEADIDVADGIAALAEDEATRIILCCMETCRDGERLVAALELARSHGKPVIVLKVGSTEQGQAAAASHTGALTGSDAVIDAVFRRHGALRVRSVEELIDIGHAASILMPGRLPQRNAVTLMAPPALRRDDGRCHERGRPAPARARRGDTRPHPPRAAHGRHRQPGRRHRANVQPPRHPPAVIVRAAGGPVGERAGDVHVALAVQLPPARRVPGGAGARARGAS